MDFRSHAAFDDVHEQMADMALGDCLPAIDTLIESMNIRKTLGHRKGEIECLTSLAEAYLSVGKVDTARKVKSRASSPCLRVSLLCLN